MSQRPHYNLRAYEGRDLSAYTRAGVVTYFLLQGARLSTSEVATLVELTHAGAHNLMNHLTAALPIGYDEDRQWYYTGDPVAYFE